MEGELGIPVLRHSEKKPAGGAADLEAYFGCGRKPRQATAYLVKYSTCD